ncbi:MAG TPA: hypothetical protein VIW71_01635 [Streptomyces sp.]
MTVALRVLRGSGPAVLGRWAVVAGASAGTGLLLLCSLGWALAHPQRGSYDALVRLAWCVVPLVVTVQLASAVGRAQPAGWPRTGLAAVGLGRTAVVLLSVANSAVVCAVGSVGALLVFLHLRGDVTGVPFHGIGPGVLAAGKPLPLAGAVTLLALVPVAAAATSAAGLRPARIPSADAPGGLPWGAALAVIGLALEVTAPRGHALPLPSGLGSVPPGSVGGWLVTTTGMMLAGPGLVHACGRLLVGLRPNAVRLLAGRALQAECRRAGRPLALLSATAAAFLATYDLHHPLGPLTTFAAVLVAVCVLATSCLALLEGRETRTPTAQALRELGASPTLLRTSTALAAAALLAAAVPLTLLIATLSSIPAE